MPYIYIEKVLTELKPQLLSAMHSAVEREVRTGQKVDVNRLYRAFVRGAYGQCSNPVRVSDKCIEDGSARPSRGKGASAEKP